MAPKKSTALKRKNNNPSGKGRGQDDDTRRARAPRAAEAPHRSSDVVRGLGVDATLGQQVARALEAVWQYNRPSFASPNTYGGMAWDRAHTEVAAVVFGATDIAQVWDALDARHNAAELLHGNERNAYEFYVLLCQSLVTHEYGARPAPPVPPAPNFNQAIAQVLVDPKMHQDTMDIVEEQDFPMLFERSLMAMVRVWPMLPAGARRFAAIQLAGWLRSVGADGAAAEVESLD